jgi:predicted PurR-regulated permease PerM
MRGEELLEEAKVSKYIFLATLLVLLYLTFKLAQPFLTYLFLGVILTMAVYPFYKWLDSKLKHKKLSSIITIVLILIIIIIPASLIMSALVKQTIGFITTFNPDNLAKANDYIIKMLGPKADLTEHVDEILINIKDFVLKTTLSIAGSVADIILGLFIMFFVMYYCFIDGNKWLVNISKLIPLSKKRKINLIKEVQGVTKGVIYGQVLMAILQGTLGGIGFFAAGISSPVFWGFIMTIFAFLPFVGTGLVWIPAGIIEITKGNAVVGILLLIYGFFIVSGIDNLLKPRIISGQSKLHPAVALIGLLGGLKVFGIVGMIIGPLIAALFFSMAGFFYEDYIKKKNS